MREMIGSMNEPGLYRDLKDVILDESDRSALLEALGHKGEWLKYFVDTVGIFLVQDVIEDLCLGRRIYKEKLAISERRGLAGKEK